VLLGDPDGPLRLPREALALQRGLRLMYAARLTEAAASAKNGLRAAEEHGSGYLLAGRRDLLRAIRMPP
jgi:hypothetical protein